MKLHENNNYHQLRGPNVSVSEMTTFLFKLATSTYLHIFASSTYEDHIRVSRLNFLPWNMEIRMDDVSHIFLAGDISSPAQGFSIETSVNYTVT